MLRASLLLALAAALVLGACVWLNAPKSLPLMLRAAREGREPVRFDIHFSGLDPHLSRMRVDLFYFPETPILGISSHPWSIIAPNRIDTISRTLEVPVRDGSLVWSAPLGLLGVSNYRLRSLAVGEPGAAYALQARAADDPARAPRRVDFPHVEQRAGAYSYDGAHALWGRLGSDEESDYSYSPRVGDVVPQNIWYGLRTFDARIDLTPYPVASFVVPAGWSGNGWTNEGFRLSRPHASLTGTSLAISRGANVPLPFSRECVHAPQFALVAAADVPAWSKFAGLWRPVARATWMELSGRRQPDQIRATFQPSSRGNPSLDRIEAVLVNASSAGTFRLFAACPNPHYDSVAVTWIDIVAR